MGIFTSLFESLNCNERNSLDWILEHIKGLPPKEELQKRVTELETLSKETDSNLLSMSKLWRNFQDGARTVEQIVDEKLKNIDIVSLGVRPDTWTPTADEVGARPNTWTPTAADVGAPPITLGWGGLPTTVISTEEELNNATTPGAYKFAILNSNINNIPINYGLLIVLAYDDNEKHQYIIPVNSHIVIERHYSGGVWGVWFCKNPPLEYGVEYRITPTTYRKRELLDVDITSEDGLSDTVYTKTYANVAHFNGVYAAFGVTENDFPDKLMPYNYLGEIALIQTVASGSIVFRVGGGICVKKLYLDMEYVKSS